ncbi:hypothetical protein TvY486_0006250 [Trypanosoma vivax Y486]|uniref:Uncharacterized protein n=1 Tax=Trypanosoma vivax (strain Y486) TaxID=1055687 RepID=F9WKH1_TRYVY|nr:hypothetical protein TvY486_0006250 [Trypanosoma vivax Y486]|eukprot:CCD17991.1 hypothetical protein TvY486_0006250 [Trypanosoma vivax Y486]
MSSKQKRQKVLRRSGQLTLGDVASDVLGKEGQERTRTASKRIAVPEKAHLLCRLKTALVLTAHVFGSPGLTEKRAMKKPSQTHGRRLPHTLPNGLRRKKKCARLLQDRRAANKCLNFNEGAPAMSKQEERSLAGTSATRKATAAGRVCGQPIVLFHAKGEDTWMTLKASSAGAGAIRAVATEPGTWERVGGQRTSMAQNVDKTGVKRKTIPLSLAYINEQKQCTEHNVLRTLCNGKTANLKRQTKSNDSPTKAQSKEENRTSRETQASSGQWNTVEGEEETKQPTKKKPLE